MYTNADCMMNKLSELKLSVTNYKPDIIGFAEVKPKNSRYNIADSEIAIEGYETFSTNLHNKTGRGLVLYIKNFIKANPVEFKTEFEESVFVSIILVSGDMLLVGCIYRSSSDTDINNERLLNLLSEINGMQYSHILLMGDFNFEKINW